MTEAFFVGELLHSPLPLPLPALLVVVAVVIVVVVVRETTGTVAARSLCIVLFVFW